MFYDAKSDFFYHCNSKLYYSNKKQAYFRLVEGMESPAFEKVAGASDLQTSDRGTVNLKPADDGNKSIKIHIRSKSLSKSRAHSESQAKVMADKPLELDKKRREQLMNAEKWNQLSLKTSLLHSQVAASTSVLPKPLVTAGGSERTKSTIAATRDTSGELRHVSKDQEVKAQHITVATTSTGQPICLVCKRKFSTLEQLRRHEERSELHKSNLVKSEARTIAQPVVEIPKYEDRAKRRRLIHGDVPMSFSRTHLVTPGNTVTGTESIDPEVVLGDQNIGHQLLQKIMSKPSIMNGGKDLSLSQSIKEDWKRIESIANSRCGVQDPAGSRRGLGL